jgi:hypothetical protein
VARPSAMSFVVSRIKARIVTGSAYHQMQDKSNDLAARRSDILLQCNHRGLATFLPLSKVVVFDRILSPLALPAMTPSDALTFVELDADVVT